MQLDLQDLLNRNVDLISDKAVSKYIRPFIDNDKELIYEKNNGDTTKIHHILDAISEIENFTKDTNFDAFQDNSMMHSACVRQLEIIGEASSRLSENLRLAD